MWCTAVVDSFQGLCVLDMTTRDHSASDTRHGCTPQVLTFPTAAAHTRFCTQFFRAAFWWGTHPRPERTSSLSQKILLSGSHTRGRGLAHNENEIIERIMKDICFALLWPLYLTTSTSVFSNCNLIYYLNSISRWSREQCRSD